MKICAVSDLHSYLPFIPDCDILFIGGDILWCATIEEEYAFLKFKFKPWLTTLKERGIEIGIVAGNHDWVFEKQPEKVKELCLPCHYMEDSEITIKGARCYGSPFSVQYFNWAFMEYEVDLAKRWQNIPEGLDILITHGPAFGAGDLTEDNRRTGSISLREVILEKKPKYHLTAHIHENYGKYMIGDTVVYNCSLVDRSYFPSHPIVEFTL